LFLLLIENPRLSGRPSIASGWFSATITPQKMSEMNRLMSETTIGGGKIPVILPRKTIVGPVVAGQTIGGQSLGVPCAIPVFASSKKP
jgi:hypothetical protein